MDRRIELVISKMETQVSRSWDSQSLADLVNLSASRFRHLFKQETGTSPTLYFRELRLRKAEVMLRTTFLSIKEIVKQTGLGSNSHFSPDFKERYGMTPRAYRTALTRMSQEIKSKERKR